MTTAQRALALVAALATLPTAAACNAILGIEDVKLRRDAGIDEDDDDDDIDPDPDPDPVPDRLETALGELHSCARFRNGTVRCWGDDTQGQTGSGGPADGGFVDAPAFVTGLFDATAISAGRNHACATRLGGDVACWGYNLDGQLGNGESGNRRAEPTPVAELTGAIAVAAGGNFSCAVRRSGRIACWGGNGSGQLGTGDEAASRKPAPVVDVSNAVAISAGQAHACAVTNDGAVACWGEGQNGQLGAGEARSSPLPVIVASLSDVTAVAAGERSTCALTTAGSVYCWGANELGQLGTGEANAVPNPTPTRVSGLDGVTAIAAGNNHTCAVRESGSVMCWGAGARGQLGDGQDRSSGGAAPSPVLVSGIDDAVTVGAGGEHACATTRADAILCWGANDRGQLGDGTTESELSPTPVRGVP